MKRRKRGKASWARRLALGVIGIPGLYLIAALIGGLIPVNANWTEPARGITVYIADNGVHADLIMPVSVDGLDWTLYLPSEH